MAIFTAKAVDTCRKYMPQRGLSLMANILDDEAKSLRVLPLDPEKLNDSSDAPQTVQKDEGYIYIQIEDADEK